MPTFLYHVDAFTRAPFRGNPAAVVILEEDRDGDWMQAVAREMNVSETAFALPRPDGTFALRWFTPTTEVPLCGHATLATAAVLLREKIVQGGVVFHTQSGPLVVEPHNDGYAMTMPAYGTEPADAPAVVAALNLAVTDVRFSAATRKLLVRVPSAADVLAARPAFASLLSLPNPIGVQGIIVTASLPSPGLDDPHFVSRFFAPWVGIDEDPVTGSAHCVLGPYWGERLGLTYMRAAQLSARRGDLGVEVDGQRVILTGSCVILSRGLWVA